MECLHHKEMECRQVQATVDFTSNLICSKCTDISLFNIFIVYWVGTSSQMVMPQPPPPQFQQSVAPVGVPHYVPYR